MDIFGADPSAMTTNLLALPAPSNFSNLGSMAQNKKHPNNSGKI